MLYIYICAVNRYRISISKKRNYFVRVYLFLFYFFSGLGYYGNLMLKQKLHVFISDFCHVLFTCCTDYCVSIIAATKITAAQNEVALICHRARGLYFMAVIFATALDVLE